MGLLVGASGACRPAADSAATPKTRAEADSPHAAAKPTAAPSETIPTTKRPPEDEKDTPKEEASSTSAAPSSGPKVDLQANIDLLRDVGNEMLEAWAKIRSVRAKVNVSMDQRENPFISLHGEGVREQINRDGRSLVYLKMLTTFSTDNPSQDGPDRIWTGRRTRLISDGVYAYVHEETHDGERYYKTWARPPQLYPLGGPALMRLLLRLQSLRQEEDMVFHGDWVHVFKGLTNNGQAKVTVKIRRDIGMLVDLRIANPQRGVKRVITLSEIETNVDIPEDRFVFQPPEGVTVQDMTVSKTDETKEGTPAQTPSKP
ncbi:MAG: hypothetical protein D6788_01260 [Planctomycetota bacterium]|nr:MAG: hypothetical protein D6788_01260 [Planctomycetota bacterium]